MPGDGVERGARKYRGVSFHATGARAKRWRATIIRHKKRYHSPYFATAKEAEDWYEAKSLEFYGYDRIHDPLPLTDEDLS